MSQLPENANFGGKLVICWCCKLKVPITNIGRVNPHTRVDGTNCTGSNTQLIASDRIIDPTYTTDTTVYDGPFQRGYDKCETPACVHCKSVYVFYESYKNNVERYKCYECSGVTLIPGGMHALKLKLLEKGRAKVVAINAWNKAYNNAL
jgi:hypothetical protein